MINVQQRIEYTNIWMKGLESYYAGYIKLSVLKPPTMFRELHLSNLSITVNTLVKVIQ